MGACQCCPTGPEVHVADQFASLVVPKPAPVNIVDIASDSTDCEIPLFAAAPSDDDEVEVSDVEVLIDSDEQEAP